VWFDDRKIGPSPVVVESVPVGLHRVHASADGHLPAAWVETLTTENTATVRRSLAPIAPERELRLLRYAMIADGRGEVSARRAARIAKLASLEFLVVVRDGRDDGFEAAILRAPDATLGAWMTVPSAEFANAWASLGVNDAVRGATADRNRDGEDAARPWYATWWGKGALAGGALMAVGAVVYVLASRGDGEVDIGGWCVRPSCP
jgi:hypothetical protein